MQNKIVLIDIDHTLFNTDKYQQEAFKKVATAFPNVEVSEVTKAAYDVYAKMREVDVFHPYRFAQLLIAYLDSNADKQKIVEILENKELLASCVFADVHMTLQKLSNAAIRLGIFSSGDRKLQMAKIDVIGHFFKEKDIHIFPLKDIEIPKVLKQYSGDTIYIIDDVERVLAEISQITSSVATIWIRRKESKYHDGEIENYTPNYEVSSLSQVEKIVTK